MCQHEFVWSFSTPNSKPPKDSLAVIPHKILSTVLQQTENGIGLKTDGMAGLSAWFKINWCYSLGNIYTYKKYFTFSKYI